MIAVCGEALIDLVTRDGLLEPIPGGGPFNSAIALGKLGAQVSFVGAISTDRFGDLLVGCLHNAGVDTRYVVRRSAPTPLALVHEDGNGGHDFSFYLTQTAYSDLAATDLPELAPDVRALAFGTLALATDPPAGTLELLMRREAGRRLIVLDPNVRTAVFGDPDEYRKRFDSWLALTDVVKLSDDDAAWLYPGLALDEVIGTLLEGGASLVALTLGAGGVVARSRSGGARVAALPVEVEDTVGAGDAFAGGLLRWLAAHDRLDRESVARLDEETLRDALDFAVAVSSLQCTRAGGSCPTLVEVEEFLRSRR